MPAAADLPAIRTAAVVGAGTMGSGIALAFADSGVAVTLIDSVDAGLERGIGIIRDSYSASVQRGRITRDVADERIRLITPSRELSDAAGADVVIEAVFEDLDLKNEVLSALDKIVPADRLIASNTSTLSITQLARSTAHPGRIAGLHFFSPAHVMKLLEIVRGEETAPRTLGAALQVSRLLKKTGVVANDGFGFIGNRMMLDGYFREAELLLLEGASPGEVDGALEQFGFAMGPQRVSDLGGTDVGTKARIQLYKRESRPGPYFAIADKLTELGRLGQKTGAGFYRYAPGGRDALADPDVAALIERLASERGIQRRTIPAGEIVERCVLSLILTGAKVLEEGIASRASDIDVVWTSGYGFPRRLGGPMFHADTLGISHVAERIRHYHSRLGHYWTPAALIESLAAAGKTFETMGRGTPMSLKGKAYIVGAYEHPTRKATDRSVPQLHADVALGALADAGLSIADVDGYFCAGDVAGWSAPGIGPFSMVEYLGLHVRHLDTTESWGSSYVNHVEHAVQAIVAGKCRIALITLAGRPRAEAVNPDAQHGLVKDAAEFRVRESLPAGGHQCVRHGRQTAHVRAWHHLRAARMDQGGRIPSRAAQPACHAAGCGDGRGCRQFAPHRRSAASSGLLRGIRRRRGRWSWCTRRWHAACGGRW